MPRKLVICATPSGKPLARKVCRKLTEHLESEFNRLKDAKPHSPEYYLFSKIAWTLEMNRRELGDRSFSPWPVYIVNFSSSEMKPVIKKSVRGADVFLIHHSYEPLTSPEEILTLIENAKSVQEKIKLLKKFKMERRVPENDMIAEMLIDALKRDCMAHRLTLILPYFANSRQDHRRGREGLTSRTQIKAFERCGVDSFLFVDLHSQSTAAISESHTDNMYHTSCLTSYFKEMFPDYKEKFVLVSPDPSAGKRVEYIAKNYIPIPFVICYKSRDYTKPNTVAGTHITEPKKVKDKHPLIVDDIVDTSGSVSGLIDILHGELHAQPAVIIATHALLSGSAIKRLDTAYKEGKLLRLITTDSVPRSQEFKEKYPWYVEVSLAPIIAEAIYTLYTDQPVSNVYLD